MSKKSDDFSVADAAKLAQSPAGRQLFAALQEQNGDSLQKAMGHVAAGDIEKAKQAMSAMLSDPKVQALLRQLGG